MPGGSAASGGEAESDSDEGDDDMVCAPLDSRAETGMDCCSLLVDWTNLLLMPK